MLGNRLQKWVCMTAFHQLRLDDFTTEWQTPTHVLQDLTNVETGQVDHRTHVVDKATNQEVANRGTT